MVIQEWINLGHTQQDPTATSIMVEGLDLQWLGPLPPMDHVCPPSLVTKGYQERVILSFIPDWLAKGFVVELPNPTPFLCHFSRMFSVPKGTSERRPIIDLSSMNKLLRKKHFKMEDLRKVAKCIYPAFGR